MQPAADEPAHRPSVWASVRAAAGSLVEDLPRYLAANLLWVLAGAVVGLAGPLWPPAYALGLLLVPVTCGLMHAADHAALDRAVRLRQLLDGARRRAWTHLGLAAGQCLLLAMAAVNATAALGSPGLASAVVAVVALYVGVVTWTAAVVAWPLLLDPRRSDVSPRVTLRLALGVMLAHPLSMLAIAVIELVLIAVSVQTVVLAFLVPSFGLLLAAHHVLPAADALERKQQAAAAPDA